MTKEHTPELAIGPWTLVIELRSLGIGHWAFVTGHSIFSISLALSGRLSCHLNPEP